MTVRPSGTRSAQMVSVIRTETPVGLGIDGDPVRLLIQYWTPEGDLIASVDTWKKDE